jgi:hypothetical protein
LEFRHLTISRRHVLVGGLAALASAVPPVFGATRVAHSVSDELLARALGALERHRARITLRDYIGIADFSRPSAVLRFHVMEVATGRVTSHWVAHGRGSDPDHTGWLERFSNEPHSEATSSGAYATDDIYNGHHGRTLRLQGLEASNSHAADRAIVVHAAPYVSSRMLRDQGVLGRSEGCFALADGSLNDVLRTLGNGRLLYADKA